MQRCGRLSAFTHQMQVMTLLIIVAMLQLQQQQSADIPADQPCGAAERSSLHAEEGCWCSLPRKKVVLFKSVCFEA